MTPAFALWWSFTAAAADATGTPSQLVLGEAIDLYKSALQIAGAPPLYHLRYRLLRERQYEVGASFGALTQTHSSQTGKLGIELRLGSPAYDSSGFSGYETGFGLRSVGHDPGELTLRWAAWSLTDRAYKSAVEQFARKSAQFYPPPDYPGDYALISTLPTDRAAAPSPTNPTAATRNTTDSEQITRTLSAVFRSHPEFVLGEARLSQTLATTELVDSEQTRTVSSQDACIVRAIGAALTPSGIRLSQDVTRIAPHCYDLPDSETLTRETQSAAEDLARAVSSRPMTDDFVGPVVFEGEAAVDLMRYLLVPELEGTPANVPFDTLLGAWSDGTSSGTRIGRRLLPSGWSVVDDPTRDLRAAGSFHADAEGSVARVKTLVRDGIVTDLLMSRVPRSDAATLGGHARGDLGVRPRGRAAQMSIRAPRSISHHRIERRALREASAYDCGCVVLIRKLQDPSVQAIGGDWVTREDIGPLPPPLYAILKYRDGREEWVHGLRFAGVTRFTLRDIAGAGPNIERAYLAPPNSAGDWSYMGMMEGIPTTLSAPELWIREMELVPVSGNTREIPLLPSPRPED